MARDWIEILRRQTSLDDIRQGLLERINQNHFATYSGDNGMHDLDRVIVRDCARVWRGLLHPRSEQLAEFSVLQALADAARGTRRDDLSPAFWAEIGHLVDGIEGRVHLHEKDSLEMTDGLSGREAAMLRSDELDRLGSAMNEAMERIADGLSDDAVARRRQHASEIMRTLGGSEEDWSDWHWQLRHIARTGAELGNLVTLDEEERRRMQTSGDRHIPLGITPYYASLFDESPSEGRDLAIRMQVIPPASYIDAFDPESESSGAKDFMLEADTSPIDLVTRRYPAISILKPFNSCPQICVYCQRNWEINGPMQEGSLSSADKIAAAVGWIAKHPTIHEVLVTGGDPLVLSDDKLREILDALTAIPHLERIRIGTRTLLTLPMRITPELCRLLGTYRIPGKREICIVTHAEHAYELTPDFVSAVNRLRLVGIPVYNQLVYTFFVSRRFEAARLRRLLRRCGVDPYYTFYPKGKAETADYRVPIARLLQEQKEEARLMPGLARTDEAVFNVPGLGKNNLNSWQHRDLVSIRPNGSRVYEFHPWEKKISSQKTFLCDDVPLLDYLARLERLGESADHYDSIWYYY